MTPRLPHSTQIWCTVALYGAALALCLATVGCAGGKLPADAGVQNGLGQHQAAASGASDVADAGEPTNWDASWQCNVFTQNCPDQPGKLQKCVPGALDGKPRCVSAGTQKPTGASCSTILDCVKGTACVDIGNGQGPACTRMCDPNSHVAACQSGYTCTGKLANNAAIGLCAHATVSCDIYAQNCPTSQDCVLVKDAAGNINGEFCGMAGSQQSGQSCSASQACARGMICVRLADHSGPTCQPVCKVSGSPNDIPCPSSLHCTGWTTQGHITFCQ